MTVNFLYPVRLPQGECNDYIELCQHIHIIATKASVDEIPEYQYDLIVFCQTCKDYIFVKVYVN